MDLIVNMKLNELKLNELKLNELTSVWIQLTLEDIEWIDDWLNFNIKWNELKLK